LESNQVQNENFLFGDLNRDGSQDLVVTNAGDDAVSFILGNGNGTFRPKTDLAVGNEPSSSTLADLNGDENLDLIVANTDSSNVSVLLGNGDGSFGVLADYGTGSRPESVTVGDANNDGRLDLATSNSGSGTASVLLGRGDGTFENQERLDLNVSGTDSVLLGDFDADKDLDLLTTGGNILSIRFNNIIGGGSALIKAERRYIAVEL
jgi:hypothetical protein